MSSEPEVLERLRELAEAAERVAARRREAVSRRGGTKPLRIVFIAEFVTMREAKISSALRSHGVETVFLHKSTPSFDLSSDFDVVQQFKTAEEALRLAGSHDAHAYHISACHRFNVAIEFIKEKRRPVVFDDYDFLYGNYKTREESPEAPYLPTPQLYDQELYCMEHAAGLCLRSLGMRPLRRKFPHLRQKKSILFMDYCSNYSLPAPAAQEPDREKHMVYVGGVHIPKYHGRESAGTYLGLVRELAEVGVHMHLYPTIVVKGFEEDYDEHFELAEKCRFFHIHRPVPHRQLIEEISRLDFGLFHFPMELDPTHHAHNAAIGIGNKFFDYIDAGLVGVTFPHSFAGFILKRYKAGITPTWSEMAGALAEMPRERIDMLKQGARGARAVLDIKPQAARLLDFYKRL